MLSKRTILYFVRHGQTEGNEQGRWQGHLDSPLTDLGVKQAEWLGEALSNETIDCIYTSSSPRAKRTAELIRGSRDIPLFESDELKEIHLGEWEGRSQEEIRQTDPVRLHHFLNDPEKFQAPGGESYADVFHRTVAYISTIIDLHAGQSVLVVAHTVVVKVLMNYFARRALKELWNSPYIHPASLSKIEWENGEARILLHGDISHYKDEA
jgi:probable phosphoglycerate mutase